MTTSKGSHGCNWKKGCILTLKTMTSKSQDLIDELAGEQRSEEGS